MVSFLAKCTKLKITGTSSRMPEYKVDYHQGKVPDIVFGQLNYASF